ncbi:MAG: cysteine desulfurase, partial [Deferribacteres bacterium]|nr:cysteine desulfurase [Deferribacteres bacterium]
YLPVDRYGLVNPRDVASNIKNNTILITIMHSNNETGAIQPIAETGRIARERGIVFHCDAAQSVGKVTVNVKRLHADLLTVVPHKFYGPKGTGALYRKKGTELLPLMFGASHEKGLRPGTENVAGIVGFGKASEIAKKELPERAQTMKRLTRIFHSELRARIPGIKLNGHPVKRLPNTLNISFPGVSGALLLERLKNEIAASTGSACHEGRQTPSPVLKAMGLGDKEALSSIRLSIGRNTTEGQIRKAVRAIAGAWQSLIHELSDSRI